MARVISDPQYEAVTSLPGADRYSHFIWQVADWEAVWSLRDDDGWRLVGDSVGCECLPVWPHERYATAYAKGRFDGCRPEAISIDDWLRESTCTDTHTAKPRETISTEIAGRPKGLALRYALQECQQQYR